MIVIKEKEFEMVQTSGPFFDLSVLSKINEGKDNEREEMKLLAHGLPFETCIKHIVNIKMSHQDKVYTVKEYVEEYKRVVNEISELIKEENG